MLYTPLHIPPPILAARYVFPEGSDLSVIIALVLPDAFWGPLSVKVDLSAAEDENSISDDKLENRFKFLFLRSFSNSIS